MKEKLEGGVDKTIDVKTFTEKYIDYFLTKFDHEAKSYYDLFESPFFPDECRSLGFEMDCGQRFVETYGKEAWRSNDGLLLVIDKATNIKILGSGLFSKWRFFNHWACSHAT
ncbi:MAG: hypothetical protein J5867_03815, partial [Prevotella sp.]|nr:hypothetical protein [Prevotella sp.]